MSVAKLIAHERQQRESSSQPFQKVSPLPLGRTEAPELPSELVPTAFRGWLSDISERMQVPLEFAAVPGLVSFSSVVGRKLGIHPKAQDDWLVVPNLWGGIIARPGKMKSPTLGEALGPIRCLEFEALQRHQESVDADSARLDLLRVKEGAIKDKMKRIFRKPSSEDPDALEKELTEVGRAIRELEQGSRERRFIVNDPTIEKLGELFMSNRWGLLLERDELAGWLRSLDRDDRRGNREFFLESWNGKNPYTYDRIGRGTIRVPALCLSIIGGIQPTKLSRYVSEALAGGFAADGLLQRFQLLVWPEDARSWTLLDRPPNIAARESALASFRRVNELEGCQEDRSVPALRFASDAQELFYDWLTQLELRLGSEEMRKTPAFESHLSKYRSLMPSLALLFHLAEADDMKSPVGLRSAQLSADWCDFLEQHARKVYDAELRSGAIIAHALARKIQERAIISGMTVRDVYNTGWSMLKKADQVLEGLSVLEEHGWARLEVAKTGGRPKSLIAVNPQVLE